MAKTSVSVFWIRRYKDTSKAGAVDRHVQQLYVYSKAMERSPMDGDDGAPGFTLSAYSPRRFISTSSKRLSLEKLLCGYYYY
jgi:hypothetical protein